MKKKQILAMGMSAALLCAGSALAADAEKTPVEPVKAEGEKVVTGTEAAKTSDVQMNVRMGAMVSVTSVQKEADAYKSMLVKTEKGEEIQLNLDAMTLVVNNETGVLAAMDEIKAGDKVFVYYSPAMTRSLPPQSACELILVNVGDKTPASLHEVGAVNREEYGKSAITTAAGDMVVRVDGKTAMTALKTKNIVTAEDLTEGTRFLAWYDMVAMSYPGQAYTEKLVVLPKVVQPELIVTPEAAKEQAEEAKKAEEAKTETAMEELKPAEKAEEPKAEEAKAEEAKTETAMEELKPAEKTEEPKAEEAKAEEAKTETAMEELKPAAKAEEPKAEVKTETAMEGLKPAAKAEEPKAEAKAEEAKTETAMEELKPAEKVEEPKAEEAKAEEAKTETAMEELKPAEKVEEPKTEETKPEETKPEETKPVEATELTVVAGDKTLATKASMKDGKAVIAVREVAEALGFQVDYAQKDGKEYVTIQNDMRKMTLEIGVDSYVSAPAKEGMVGMPAPAKYGVAPYIVEDRTYAAAELFEAMIGFDVEVKDATVTITAKK